MYLIRIFFNRLCVSSIVSLNKRWTEWCRVNSRNFKQLCYSTPNYWTQQQQRHDRQVFQPLNSSTDLRFEDINIHLIFSKCIRGEIAVILFNMTVSNAQITQSVLDAGALTPLIALHGSSDFEMVRTIIQILSNAILVAQKWRDRFIDTLLNVIEINSSKVTNYTIQTFN